jgi:hypothetical protein
MPKDDARHSVWETTYSVHCIIDQLASNVCM